MLRTQLPVAAAMNDSAVIDYAPPITASNVVGGGAYCAGDSGVVIGLDASEIGTVYQLLQGGVLPSATPVLEQAVRLILIT